MNCTQKQQLVSFPKVRIWKSWFRYFNNHKEFRNEGTVHLFSLMALFSYANFRSNERVINGERYMEAPGQWICKLGSLPRILRVHSKRQALEQLDYYEKYGFLTYEWLDEENEIIRFSTDADYRKICSTMMARHKESLKTIPAAKSVHHGFISGLLMHTATMMKTADFLSGVHGDIIDRSLLLAGTFLHDFAKESEFTFSQLGLVTEYSVKGQLLGHLVMGAQEVAAVASELGIPEDKSVLLQHMILSHHGEPEFGAAVKPICAESELLSQIDMLDSRMEIYRETLAGLQVGEVSSRIFALDKRVFKPHELNG